MSLSLGILAQLRRRELEDGAGLHKGNLKEVSECPESLLSELMVSVYNTVNSGSLWYTTLLVCMDHISVQESFLEEEDVSSYLYQ